MSMRNTFIQMKEYCHFLWWILVNIMPTFRGIARQYLPTCEARREIMPVNSDEWGMLFTNIHHKRWQYSHCYPVNYQSSHKYDVNISLCLEVDIESTKNLISTSKCNVTFTGGYWEYQNPIPPCKCNVANERRWILRVLKSNTAL